MGDGPNYGTGDGTTYHRNDGVPWPNEPETIPKRYYPNGAPANALDDRHEPIYPDQLPRRNSIQVDTPSLAVPASPYGSGLDVSESFAPIHPIRNTIKKDNAPAEHNPFPTAAEVHGQVGRYLNTNLDIAQLAWHGFKLYPHQPWPKFPPMFSIVDKGSLNWKHLNYNYQNLTNKNWLNAVGQKFGPISTAGAAFLVELAIDRGIDKVYELDKTEYQTGRIVADLFGPTIALSARPSLQNWLVKGACMVATHTAGRLFDKFTEAPIKKFMRLRDE
ncbi:MAG: hypothetical protein K2X29_04080 [Candidatus Obscuribacterales bacterium]|nr:hypothetical protein [Candidatus Obscuribacterales bacterium]